MKDRAISAYYFTLLLTGGLEQNSAKFEESTIFHNVLFETIEIDSQIEPLAKFPSKSENSLKSHRGFSLFSQ